MEVIQDATPTCKEEICKLSKVFIDLLKENKVVDINQIEATVTTIEQSFSSNRTKSTNGTAIPKTPLKARPGPSAEVEPCTMAAL